MYTSIYKIRYKPTKKFVKKLDSTNFTTTTLNHMLSSHELKFMPEYILSKHAGCVYRSKYWAKNFLSLLNKDIVNDFEIVEFKLPIVED